MAALPADIGDLQNDIRAIRLAQVGDAVTAEKRDTALTAWLKLITIALFAGLAANLMLAFTILMLVLVRQ